MRLVRTISTPWAAFAVTFSHDGTRLAIGGGTWYGRGGIHLVDLRGGEPGIFECESLPTGQTRGIDLTISGLCFSTDDRFLIASTWSMFQCKGPLVVLEVVGTELRYVQMIAAHPEMRGAPTGLVLVEDLAVVRQYRTEIDTAIVVYRMPPLIFGDRSEQHLSSKRVVVHGELAVTGGHGVYLDSEAAGLVTVPLAAQPRTPASWTPLRGQSQVTAIGLSRSQDCLITGGADGALDEWTWRGHWERRPVRTPTTHEATAPPGRTRSAVYTLDGITAICSLPDGRAASVNASGELTLWSDCVPLTTHQLDESGTPRALAAHPGGGLLAIGLKQGAFKQPCGAVVLGEPQPLAVEPGWRSPAVIALARAAYEQRGAAGELDPLLLAVLADVLEQLGCLHALHLRTHAPRLHDCWLIDGLLCP
jgi:hypothetical protein